YLLTFADMRAVGPKVWNPWKGGLLDELYLRTLERFETGESPEEEREARLQRRKTRLSQTLKTLAPSSPVETFLSAMPENYLLSTPEEAVPGHFQLFTRFAHRDQQQANALYRAALTHVPE